MDQTLNDTIKHYDLLVTEGNDPVHDPQILRDYMDKWDGQTFIDNMKLDHNKAVLEIGVGTGRLSVRVAPLCSCFYGIDISPKTICRAKDNLALFDNIELYCGDFLTFNFTRKFDVIYSSLTFMHIKEKYKAIDKVATLLNKGGRFVLSIDKNLLPYIDISNSKITVYPDNPNQIMDFIKHSRLHLIKNYETEFAHIFVADKHE